MRVDWLKRDSLEHKQHGSRRRKLDRQALARHIETHPNLLLRERAAHFGVPMYSIQYAYQQLRISHKNPCATPNETLSNAWPIFARCARLSASVGRRVWSTSMRAALRPKPIGLTAGHRVPRSNEGAASTRAHPAPLLSETHVQGATSVCSIMPDRWSPENVRRCPKSPLRIRLYRAKPPPGRGF